jgi:hypothetical protein
VEALGLGRNSVAIWQDLVDDHGFTARYASVRRFVLKLRAHCAAGEMIDDRGDPPAERPALRQCEREPRDPESADRRNRGEIEVPDVVGMLGGHSSKRRWLRALRGRFGLRLEHPAHGGRAEMQSGAREHTSESSCAHPRAQRAQPANELADELREAVHRLPHLDERVGPFVVKPLCPRCDGERRDKEPSRGLGLRPGARCAQLQDRETLDRRLVRPTLRGEALHARVLDAEFLLEHRNLTLQSVGGGLQAGAGVNVNLGPSQRCGAGDVRHRDGVDDGRADVT